MSNGTLDPDLADLLGSIDEDIAESKSEAPATAPTTAPKKISVPEGKDYLKKVVEGETSEYTDRLLEQLDKAMNSSSKEDRSIYRGRLMATYWNFLGNMVTKITGKFSTEKQLCVRYGIIDMTLLDPEQSELIKGIPLNSGTPDYPFYYMDEWLKEVASGKIKPSMADESAGKKTDSSKVQEKFDRKTDSKAATLSMHKSKTGERQLIEKAVQAAVNTLFSHQPLPEFENILDAYSAEQKNMMTQVIDDFRKLKTIDTALITYLRELRDTETDISSIKSQMGSGQETGVDSLTTQNELNSLRQMIKMSAGPRGNHFPILISDYCPVSAEYINSKEKVIKSIQELEKKDEEAFFREFKGQKNRILPYIILAPGYGENGVCWEPFDIKQRATSRGRIALPLFPKNPMMSLLTAVGDLRWQVAKEKAGYRWMEEGLTGKYYTYFMDEKLKGDIKESFISDYILWVTQEWNGMQKLHKDSRTIFWRHIPFPQDKKDDLKNRGFFYNELHKKDVNRSMSDGY